MTGTSIAVSRTADIKKALDARVERYIEIAGDKRTADRAVASAMLAVTSTPALLDCSPESVARAVYQAVISGADLSAGRGEGFLIPFKGQAVFMDGYRLWSRRMAEAGYVVVAEKVCAGDEFSYQAAPLDVRHTFDPFADRGEVRGYYAAAWRGGELCGVAVVTAAETQTAREGAKKKNGGRESPAWASWPDQMAKRLPIKRLARMLDLRDVGGLWEASDEADRGPVEEEPARQGQSRKIIEVAEGAAEFDFGPPAFDAETGEVTG
jgi:recombination protein RecT